MVLRNVRRSLRDGGTFVMDMVGKEHIQSQGMEARRTQFADGAVLIQQPHARDDWTRLASEWTVVKNGQSRSYRFEHHLYSGPELQELLLSCGFDTVRLYGDLHGAPYGGAALRLVAVAS